MQSFGKTYRLLKTDDFSSVFALKQVSYCAGIRIYSMSGRQLHARLGIAVSKKVARRANRRNYMKRRLREWFRCNNRLMPVYDYVFHIQKPFNREEASCVIHSLDKWLKWFKIHESKLKDNDTV